MVDEWVEVHGKSIDDAVQAALEELGLESAEEAEIAVLQEPQRGFLGVGSRDAVVRVQRRRRRRRRRGGRGRRRGGGGSEGQSEIEKEARGRGKSRSEQPARQRAAGRRSGHEPSGRGGSGDRESREQKERERTSRSGRRERARKDEPGSGEAARAEEEAVMADPTEQAAVVGEFLEGLLDAFGLEGNVSTRVEEDIIYADISGEQTEALIGAKGSILQAILELARTVVQRKTQAGARLRIDIAGYGERRREALRIYAARLAEQVLEEGGEVMLEPMNPADRKVVHDVIAEIDGVRSYSEGEEPRRSVVVSPASVD